MNEVIPGILEHTWPEIEKKIELVKSFAKTIHIDIIDGKFAPNSTFLDPQPFRKYSDNIFFELHMMVDEPINYLRPWADAGFKRFLGHIERMSSQNEFINSAKEHGEAGLAIDGPTNISAITISLGNIETLLFMGITAGFSGQKFNSEYLSKIREAEERGFNGNITVDGGINNETIISAKNKGANRVITTSYLFGCSNVGEEYHNLTAKINS